MLSSISVRASTNKRRRFGRFEGYSWTSALVTPEVFTVILSYHCVSSTQSSAAAEAARKWKCRDRGQQQGRLSEARRIFGKPRAACRSVKADCPEAREYCFLPCSSTHQLSSRTPKRHLIPLQPPSARLSHITSPVSRLLYCQQHIPCLPAHSQLCSQMWS